MTLQNLATQIRGIDSELKIEAAKAINLLLTLRNWLIGYHIVEYELNGADRAKYGDTLIDSLAKKINRRGLSFTSLKLCRQFYETYPQIGQTLSNQISNRLGKALPGKLRLTKSLNHALNDPGAILPEPSEILTPPYQLINRLSFSHLVELIKIDHPLKRTFYEIESIKAQWNVRELRRQINSLYFERSGMSENPEKLARITRKSGEILTPSDVIKNVYSFEFLGLPMKGVVEESDLEKALLDHLEQFMLELGNGFCFEARQKRLLIGDEYFFVDLIFYHRILKCHVLLELKIGKFSAGDASQLNAYLNFFKKNVMELTDNPPVGILLVTDKNDALVEFATAGMDETVFVKNYLMQLPTEEQLRSFLKQELNSL